MIVLIITVKQGDSIATLSKMYGVPQDKIGADNGIQPGQSLVVGQSLIILKEDSFVVPNENTTVDRISQQTGISQKTIFRNNFFLGGRQEVEKSSFVVLEYENSPLVEKITGGYAYDFIGIESLYSVINYLTYIMPFTYGFTRDGSLVYADDEYIIRVAKENGVKPIMHLSTLTKDGVFDSNLPTQVFSNSQNRDNLLNNVVQTVIDKDYDGVDVDFEFLPQSESDNYVDFLAQLSERLKELGKILIVALPPKTSDEQRGLLYEGIDYAEIGKYADYTLLMTYEYGYRFGPPLAIAPLPSVRRVVEYAKTRIPSRKLLLGIPNYGYDWTLPFVRGESDAPSISPLEAVDIARQRGVEIMYDEYSQAPYFFYTDDEGREHEVWFEDARSYREKIKLIEEYDLAGGFIWELMRENPQGFVTVNSMLIIP